MKSIFRHFQRTFIEARKTIFFFFFFFFLSFFFFLKGGCLTLIATNLREAGHLQL